VRSTRFRGGEKEKEGLLFLKAASPHLDVIAQNYRCPLGEVDLLLRDGQELVVVEIRSCRKGQGLHFGALESVNLKKRVRIERVTQWFLSSKRARELEDQGVQGLRFDVLYWEAGAWKWCKGAWS